MNETNTLQMTFNLDNGHELKIELKDPKSDLDAEKVGTVMGSMVAKNAILYNGAMLESTKSAVIKKVQTETLF